MDFASPLIPGTLIKRYKRFMADITLENGDVVTAHTPNSGSMKGVSDPGSRVWISPASNPERKLKYTLEIVEAEDGAGGTTPVGVNTSHPNALVYEACLNGTISEVAGYSEARREVKYGKNSRIDVLLKAPDKPDCYVEVKNVTLARGTGGNRSAEFPDAVTSRGAKHLQELGDMVADGHRAMMVYLVQRADCKCFSVAADIDPEYEAALKKALDAGVEAVCYACDVTPQTIALTHALPIRL